MRILRVAPWLYPNSKGGGEYHVHAMSRDQAAMGHNVTVLTTYESSDLPRFEEKGGYTVIRVSPGVTLLGNDVSPAVGRYLWGVDSDQFDVIHAHSHLYFTTNLAALKRRLGDIPLAITNHGLYTQSAPKWVFDIYLNTVGRWTFNQADVVFCYTDADKQRVRDLGVKSPIEVVSNGIDTDRFTSEGPTSELIDAGAPVVLFVGRLVDGKRPAIAIEAFAGVREEYPDAELVLCGEGPLESELKTFVRELGIEEAVTFLGQIPYDDMPAVYRTANVLVLPSRAEGVPRTIMEALSSGVPVVSSDLPQVRSAFGEDVIYVEQGVDSFFDAICGVYGDQSVELGSSFQWTQTVEETTKWLKHL